MNYVKIENCNLLNGDGARVVLWVSGCTHKCFGCHNPETWEHTSGQMFDKKIEIHLLKLLANPYIDGLTISGGDPLNPMNYQCVLKLCQTIKSTLNQKSIWIWTGYTLEEIQKLNQDAIFNYIDYLIDGRYINALHTKKKFRGSDNQNRYCFVNGIPKLID